MIKTYVLFLHLCCQPYQPAEQIEVKSPQAAAIVMWEKTQCGTCYEGKLEEHIWHIGESQIREIPIPKISFSP